MQRRERPPSQAASHHDEFQRLAIEENVLEYFLGRWQLGIPLPFAGLVDLLARESQTSYSPERVAALLKRHGWQRGEGRDTDDWTPPPAQRIRRVAQRGCISAAAEARIIDVLASRESGRHGISVAEVRDLIVAVTDQQVGLHVARRFLRRHGFRHCGPKRNSCWKRD